MSKLSSYSCQGQRQGQIMKVKNNYLLDEWLRFFFFMQETESVTFDREFFFNIR